MRMRLVLAMLIIVGVFGAALFALLLLQRPGSEEALLDVPAQGDEQAGDFSQLAAITDQKLIDGANVTLIYPPSLQFITESERNNFGQAPVVVDQQPVEQPTAEPTTGEQPTVDPNATAVPLPTAVPADSGGQPVVGVPSGEQIIRTPYVVAQGDTLYRISTRRDSSIALMAQYGIDVNDIVVGTTLQLPIVNPAFCAAFRDYHLVTEGDNVFRIAEKFGTTKEALQQANGLSADFLIQTNRVLCIP